LSFSLSLFRDFDSRFGSPDLHDRREMPLTLKSIRGEEDVSIEKAVRRTGRPFLARRHNLLLFEAGGEPDPILGSDLVLRIRPSSEAEF